MHLGSSHLSILKSFQKTFKYLLLQLNIVLEASRSPPPQLNLDQTALNLPPRSGTEKGKNITCSGIKNVNHISCSGVTTPSWR